MILLETENRYIADLLSSKYADAQDPKKKKVEGVHVTVADFDGVRYHVTNDSERTLIKISLSCNFYKELQEYGADQLLKEKYGSRLLDQPVEGYQVTLAYDLTQPMKESDFVEAAMLKRNCFACVFQKFFNASLKETSLARGIVHYRSDETMYIDARPDRVTVIFSTIFKDPNDIVIGKVFLQEFKEARRNLSTAPQVLFSSGTPPKELEKTNAKTGDDIAYITFVLEKRHFHPAAVGEKTIDLMCMFREYLHYHIKCSKAYIHCRMRAKTSDFLKVLNRARPDQENREKKTITGKTFKA